MKAKFVDSIRELRHYLELLINLSIKDFKARYKSATLGFLWSILNPLFLMLVFTVVFSVVVKIKIDKYPAFLLTGLIPWTFFRMSLSNSVHSIIDNSNLIKKVYFPREIIPLAIILANLYNFLLSLGVLFIFLLFFKIHFYIYLIWLPLVIFIQVIFVIGISLLCSGLNVIYRDVKFIVEALLIAWFYATPIFYALSMVPKKITPFYILNPMTGIIEMYKGILFYSKSPDIVLLLVTLSLSVGIFFFGLAIFKRNEGIFADLV